MSRKKIVLKELVVLAGLFLLSATTVWAEPCHADANASGKVDLEDLGIVKAEFFRDDCDINPCQADLNGSGKVDLEDLGIVKAEFFRDDCPVCVDMDGDGYDTCNPDNPCDIDGEPADCDDGDAEINPGNIKVCNIDYVWGDMPGRRNIPLTCGETTQFNVCSDCEEVGGNPSCFVWSIDPASTIGSTIDPDTGLYTAGTDCTNLDYPVVETIIITDICNENISDNVTVTVGQIILDLLNTNVNPDTEGVQITVSMSNTDHKVKGIQADIYDESNLLTCTGCAPDPDRAPQLICSAEYQGGGKCRVVMITTNPASLIQEGKGPVFTVDYDVSGGAPSVDCIDIALTDIKVSDRFGDDLCVCEESAEICFIGCGDVYPRECLPENPVCGDGVVDFFDYLEVRDFVLGEVELSECQKRRADVPTGTLPYCDDPDGEINNLDVLVIYDMALDRPNCCDYYYFGKIY